MNGHTRMSPLTALVVGIFAIGGIGIASGTAVVLYGMRIISTGSSEIMGFADSTIRSTLESLPELLQGLPPVLKDALNDRAAPEYATSLDVRVNFLGDESSSSPRPVLTITNKGNQVVSLLGVRVAALNTHGLPLREWTEVVATPLAIDDEWRGPLMPGNTRYVVLSGCRGLAAETTESITGAVEISQIRVLRPANEAE
jgi:hypothetical protein